MARWLSLPLVALVRLYQVTLRPLMGGHCRFSPSCSEYAVEALRTHGTMRAGWLIARRVLRCHPFGGGGFDPVPLRGSSFACAKGSYGDTDQTQNKESSSS